MWYEEKKKQKRITHLDLWRVELQTFRNLVQSFESLCEANTLPLSYKPTILDRQLSTNDKLNSEGRVKKLLNEFVIVN